MSRTPWLSMDDDLSSVVDGEAPRTTPLDRHAKTSATHVTQDAVLGYYDDPLADTPRRPPPATTSSHEQAPMATGLPRADADPFAAGVRTPASRRARIPGAGERVASTPATPPPSKKEVMGDFGPERKLSSRTRDGVEATPSVPSRTAESTPNMGPKHSAPAPKEKAAPMTSKSDVAVSPHRPYVEGPTPSMLEETQKRFQSELAALQAALLDAKESASRWEAEANRWRTKADEDDRALAEVRSQLQRTVHQTQLDGEEISRLRQWNSELARERQDWESERFRLRQELQALREETLSRPHSAAGSEPALLLNADSLRTLRELLVGHRQSGEWREMEALARGGLTGLASVAVGDFSEFQLQQSSETHRSPRMQRTAPNSGTRTPTTSALVDSLGAATPPASRKQIPDRPSFPDRDRSLSGTPGTSGRLNNYSSQPLPQAFVPEEAKVQTVSDTGSGVPFASAPQTVTPASHVVQDPNAVRHQPKEEVEEVERLERKLMTACQERGEVEEAFRKVEFLKIRSLAEKARRETLQRRLAELNHDISDARRRLRELSALER